MLEQYIEELKAKRSITLKIKVHAGAHLTRIKSVLSDGTIKVDIAKIPEDGKANDILFEFLAAEFKVSKNNIEILMGKFSGDKTIRITV